MFKLSKTCRAALLCAFLVGPVDGAVNDKSGVRLYYRMFGESHNGPLPLKTKSILAIEGEERTRTTGMATSGFTEYPFMKGRVSYTFAENFMYFPRIASGLPVDPGKDNAGDILIPQVYAPDAYVWGAAGREFVQTFVATGNELVSVTMLSRSARGIFRAALMEGGAGGEQIGLSRSFSAGGLHWGWAHWNPGQAPLTPGETYGIRIWREDGQEWVPFLHATGDAYGGGLMFSDGTPQAGSDLGIWIVEERDDLTRAVVVEGDDEEWVYDASTFTFVPRSANVRLVSLKASPVDERCRVGALTVWSMDTPARKLAGPKKCVSCGTPGRSYEVHFLFAEGELPVVAGERYRAEVRWLPFKEGETPEGEGTIVPMDLQARVYGEPQPGALPAIGNLATQFPGLGDMVLTWDVSFPCPVTVTYERLQPRELRTVEVFPGYEQLLLPRLWRGHDYRFSLAAAGPTGLKWKTPAYQLRIPDGPHGPGPGSFYPEHPDHIFVRAAGPRHAARPTARETLRFQERVDVENADFEQGLAGWRATPEGIIYGSPEVDRISPPFGDGMAGWSHRPGANRTDVREESFLTQRVRVVPGHRYLLTARVHTFETGGGPGNSRVRLLADPEGGDDFSGEHSSQWFWTGGEWMRFEHEWTAAGDRSTVGFGFYRWRDVDHSTAFVDHAVVLDLGPAERAPGDPAVRGDETVPALALIDPAEEAADRVEAWAAAPPGYVITGLGARAAGDNVTTMRLRVQPLRGDGTLGESEVIWAGWEPDAGLEANVDLPESYVATGFGARIAPEWDVKTLAVWARPLLPGGALGEEREFRSGVQPEGGLEKRVRLDEGRLLTGAGLRCGSNDVSGIRAASARLVRSATGRRL